MPNDFQLLVGEELQEEEMPNNSSFSKWWGDQNVQPVLALHGLADNCGTFDAMLPLIDTPSVLAIDLPGHGFSTHFPPGMANNFIHVVLCLRYLIKNHFGWPKVDLMGHSFGSCLAFVYSGLFPKCVKKYVSIDCARFNMGVKGSTSPELVKFSALTSLENRENTQEKTYDEFLTDFVNLRERAGYGLSVEAAKLLVARSIKETPSGKFLETTDPRLPVYIGLQPITSLDDVASRISCEVLTIRFSNGVFQKWKKTACDHQMEILKKSSTNLEVVDIDGGHHGHLESPESVASTITNFLKG